jgi:hypothetical protein
LEYILFYIKQLVIVLCLCVLGACASTEQGSSESSPGRESTGSDCISQGSIRDYTVLDNANLLVTSGVNRKYHVELSRAAHNLRVGNAIGFQSQSGRICDRFSDVVVNDGFGVEKIRIRSVRRLSAQSEEDLLIRFGKIEPEIEQARPPNDVQGAEVEELD